MANRCKLCKSNSKHDLDCPKFFHIKDIECEFCYKIFKRKIANKKYCSSNCRVKAFEFRKENGLIDLSKKSNKWKNAVILDEEGALESSFNSHIRNVIRHHKGKIEPLLTLEEFKELVTSNCFYCGVSPRRGNKNSPKNLKKNGIDRLNSSLDYIYDNCVACCWTCNRMKGKMLPNDFIRHIRQVCKKLDDYQINDNTITLEKRVSFYRAMFPDYPAAWYDKGWILGMWNIGAFYKGSGYHGAHPPSYIERITSLFPDKKDILHLFSGSLPAGDYIRFDICNNEEAQADVEGDAHNLSNYFEPNTFDIIYSDCPYTDSDALRYGNPMINRNKVVKECYKVLRQGGFLCWFDQVLPMYKKEQFRRVGEIGLSRSTNHRMRATFIFEKV